MSGKGQYWKAAASTAASVTPMAPSESHLLIPLIFKIAKVEESSGSKLKLEVCSIL